MRRKTRNVTLAIREDLYRDARRWAAHYDTSLSCAVSLILENLSDLARAVRLLRKETPHWGEDTNR
jgi:hypothetical protein